jgi:hypothetical protein
MNTLTFGGDCCCGFCPLCSDDDTGATMTAELSGITSIGDCVDGDCEDRNGVHMLERSLGTDTDVPAEWLTEPETGEPVCIYGIDLGMLTCKYQECEDCKAVDCVAEFGDHGFNWPDLETCEMNCVAAPDDVAYPPDVGQYSPPASTPEQEACNASPALICTATLSVDDGACACVSDGLGGYDCLCTGDCQCEAECEQTGPGSISVYVYKQASVGDIVVYVKLVMPDYQELHGEHVFIGSGGEIECLSSFGPLVVSLTSLTAGSGLCLAPTGITLELV